MGKGAGGNVCKPGRNWGKKREEGGKAIFLCKQKPQDLWDKNRFIQPLRTQTYTNKNKRTPTKSDESGQATGPSGGGGF